jgi:hypothetical protein
MPRVPAGSINGVRFQHALVGGPAMSHDMVGDRYRGFTHGKCYELAVSVTFSNFGVYEPGTIKEFTRQDQQQVLAQLTRILDSFRPLP